MKIIRASHLGLCFGVRRAIILASEVASGRPLSILGELVHNDTVLNRLVSRGIQIQADANQVTTPTVMVTAHGASEHRLAQVRSRGLQVVDGTCPLVRHLHEAVAELVSGGYYPVIIGQRTHTEVIGVTEDLDAYAVVMEEADLDRVTAQPRFGVVSQTTQPTERVQRLVVALQGRFPASEVRLVDTVCRPTKLRQAAAERVARQSDVVLVIGGARSNNTRELVETCRRFCRRVFHVQGPGELRVEWFDHVEAVGVTAGTSTPDDVIAQVEQRLRDIADELARHEVRCSANAWVATPGLSQEVLAAR